MRISVEQRIKEIYPSGQLDDLNREELPGKKFDKKILRFIRRTEKKGNVRILREKDSDFHRTCHLIITQPHQPGYCAWCGGFADSDRQQWLREHEEPYTVLHLDISKVLPVYRYFFNIWQPGEDREHPDVIVSCIPLSTEWDRFFGCAFRDLKRQKIRRIPENELIETVSFVHDENWFCDDSACNELQPAPDDVNVCQCLFQNGV